MHLSNSLAGLTCAGKTAGVLVTKNWGLAAKVYSFDAIYEDSVDGIDTFSYLTKIWLKRH